LRYLPGTSSPQIVYAIYEPAQSNHAVHKEQNQPARQDSWKNIPPQCRPFGRERFLLCFVRLQRSTGVRRQYAREHYSALLGAPPPLSLLRYRSVRRFRYEYFQAPPKRSSHKQALRDGKIFATLL